MKRYSLLIYSSLLLTSIISVAQIFIPFTFWSGTNPVLTISDGATYSYGTLATNTSLDKIFTVTNASVSDFAAIVTGGTFSTAAFTFKGGSYPGTGGTCTALISPSTSCSIVVTARSASGGTFNDTITLNFKNKNNTGTYSATRAITVNITSTPTDVFVIGPSFIKVNDCQAITLQSSDTNGNPINVTANKTVNLTINNAINSAYYTTSACSTTTTSRIITSGTSSVIVYFKSTTSGQSGILVATATGLTSGQLNVTITAAPSQLKLAVVPQIKTSTCTAFTVRSVDSNNFDSNVASAVTVNLTTNGANIYYSDVACGSVITSIVIASGTAFTTLYTRNTTIQIVTATATDNAGLLTPDSAPINFLLSLIWWNTSWTKRVTIAINNSDQATAFTNQAVLVKFNSSNVNYANFKSDGSDIRFIDSDSATVLDHEVETWNPSGDSEIWVRIPSIAASDDSGYFYMYFGNSSANDAQNRTGVWTNYWSVWHFGEVPTGTAPQYLDATTNARNGTATNSPTRVSGAPIGFGVGLNGSSDSVTINSDLNAALGGSSTFSAWMRTTQSGNASVGNTPGLTGINATGSANDIFFGWLDNGVYMGITATDGADAKSNFTINNGAWRYVTMNRNATTGAVRFFINGVFQNTVTSGLGTTATAFYDFGFITNSPKQFDGDLDEIRIYNSVVSDAQVKADFKFLMNTHLYYYTTEVWP